MIWPEHSLRSYLRAPNLKLISGEHAPTPLLVIMSVYVCTHHQMVYQNSIAASNEYLICGSPWWKLNINLLHISTVLPRLKCCRVGLVHVCAVYRLVRYSYIYAACISPLMNVLRYSALNAETQLKYAME